MLKSDLSMLEPGESGVIKSILPHQLTTKLVEMGLFSGKSLKVLYKAPFGDPIAVDVGGYVLSLRKDEARIITLVTETAGKS